MENVNILPPYAGLLAEYAIKNMHRKGYDISDTANTTLTVVVTDNEPIFLQKLRINGEQVMLDCWGIFELASMIQQDTYRKFRTFKVKIEFTEGEIYRMSYHVTSKSRFENRPHPFSKKHR